MATEEPPDPAVLVMPRALTLTEDQRATVDTVETVAMAEMPQPAMPVQVVPVVPVALADRAGFLQWLAMAVTVAMVAAAVTEVTVAMPQPVA